MKRLIILTILITGFTHFLSAQQSSKSKAAKKLHQKPAVDAIKIEPVNSINTKYLEFSPAFYQNGIVYASSNSSGKKDKKIDEGYFELFYAEMNTDGMPLKPEPFSLKINSQLHEGPVTFSRDGNKIFFTRNNTKDGRKYSNKEGTVHLKIYEATRTADDWDNVKELPFNSDDYSCAHPTLSADGNKLYFSSNRPGGFGKMDLWVVEKRDNGTWSTPMNLGATINTAGNDMFPFIHSSGTLFLSSDGHLGYGGLDMYMIDAKSIGASELINLGEPLNSPQDDLGLILNPAGDQGFFTSSRENGKGKDDIYLFKSYNDFLGKTKPADIPVTINIYDEKDNKPIAGAKVHIFEQAKDGEYLDDQRFDLYESVLVPSNEESSELTFQKIRKKSNQLGRPRFISPASGKKEMTLEGEKEYILVVSKNGYTTSELTYSTLGNKGEKRIDIPLGNTCRSIRGKIRDNKTKQDIADAVVRIWSGCDGKEEIVTTNTEGVFTHCVPMGCEYIIKGVKEKYESTYRKLLVNNGDQSVYDGTLYLDPIQTKVVINTPPPVVVEKKVPVIKAGTVIVLEKIYYDFNKSTIRKGAARELDEILNMMERYPSMKIELGAHTDSRGKENYNARLSRHRARSAKEYLVARGIRGSRINVVGYGESNPRNGCYDGVECSEEEHQYNRRTEVKVISIKETVNIQYQDNAPEVIDRKKQ